MKILDEILEKYLESCTSSEADYLKQLERETYQKTTAPQMLSGGYQGRFLSMISKIVRPKKVLEIGMFTGYSTLCFAEGLQPDGKIITIDRNEELMFLVQKYFDKSPYKDKIEVRIGNALEVLDEEDMSDFDLIFIDADKENYINYYEKVLPKLNSGGVILADNVLWYGKVLQEIKPNDKSSLILKEFGEWVAKDERVEVVMLPVRDGISMIRKK